MRWRVLMMRRMMRRRSRGRTKLSHPEAFKVLVELAGLGRRGWCRRPMGLVVSALYA